MKIMFQNSDRAAEQAAQVAEASRKAGEDAAKATQRAQQAAAVRQAALDKWTRENVGRN